LAFAAVVGLWSVAAPGCGEPAPNEGRAMPPEEWTTKFQNEHPEKFKTKQGRIYTDVDIRQRRAILRREWAKAQGEGQ